MIFSHLYDYFGKINKKIDCGSYVSANHDSPAGSMLRAFFRKGLKRMAEGLITRAVTYHKEAYS